MVLGFLSHICLLVDEYKALLKLAKTEVSSEGDSSQSLHSPTNVSAPFPGAPRVSPAHMDVYASPSVSSEHGSRGPGPMLVAPLNPHRNQAVSLVFSQTRRKT